MGNKQSISQEFNMSTLNKQIYNNLTTNSASASATMTNIQKLTLVVDINDQCDINLNQKISSKVVSSTDMMAQQVVDMKGEIENTLKQAADAKIKSETGAGATKFGDSAEVSTKMNTAIENIVNKTITTQNMTDTIASSVSIVGAEIHIGMMRCRNGEGGLDLTQDITSDLAATAVTDSLTEALLADKFISEVSQEQKSSNESKATGPIQDLGNAISGILGSMTAIYAICCCVVCVAIAGVIYLSYSAMSSPAGQGLMAKAGEAAIARGNPLASAATLASSTVKR